MSAEENKAVVRRVEEAWDRGELDALDALFAADFASHAAMPGTPPGLEGAKQGHRIPVQAFPDRRTTIEDIIAEGDKVVVRVRMTGTNRGGIPGFNIPANNRPVDVQWISVYRLANGKIAEHWAQTDVMGLLQQLGVMPAPR
jgi:steroid delta-isomerase-like uncharacterized protein